MEETRLIDPFASSSPSPSNPPEASPEESSDAPLARHGFRYGFQRFRRNKLAFAGMIYGVLLILFSFIGPLLIPYEYDEPSFGNELIVFSWDHPFGTDQQGRDLLVRNLYAVRNAVMVAVVSVLLGLLIGAVVGAFAGYFGGLFDLVAMRAVDILFAFPQILLLILLLVALPDSLDRRISIFVAIGLTSWAGYARLIRGQVLQAKREEYVEAARCLGANSTHILRKYILPNIAGPIIVAVSFGIPSAMMAESGMSLIGLGLRPPMPSWGNMIYDGALQMRGFPHLVLWPAITFGLTLLAFTFVGDGLGGVYGKDK